MKWFDNMVAGFFEWMFSNFYFFLGIIGAMSIILIIVMWGGGR